MCFLSGNRMGIFLGGPDFITNNGTTKKTLANHFELHHLPCPLEVQRLLHPRKTNMTLEKPHFPIGKYILIHGGKFQPVMLVFGKVFKWCFSQEIIVFGRLFLNQPHVKLDVIPTCYNQHVQFHDVQPLKQAQQTLEKSCEQ